MGDLRQHLGGWKKSGADFLKARAEVLAARKDLNNKSRKSVPVTFLIASRDWFRDFQNCARPTLLRYPGDSGDSSEPTKLGDTSPSVKTMRE